MNFQQLKAVQEAIRHAFNLTETAETLSSSQSAISRQIRELEDELGVDVFMRHGKRFVGLTPPGKELAHIIGRMLEDREALIKASQAFRTPGVGTLVVAATSAQVRYRLPSVVKDFRQAYPHVKLILRQASPLHIIELLKSGDADIGFLTEGLPYPPTLASFKAYSWSHCFIVPKGHSLTKLSAPKLSDIARHPIITFEEGMIGRSRIDKAFDNEGLKPEIVISAADSDAIKVYVKLGLGVGIIGETSFFPEVDKGLVCLPTGKIFTPIMTSVAVRRGSYLRDYASAFIEKILPDLSRQHIRSQVDNARDNDDTA